MTVHHQYSKSGNYGEEKPTREETHQCILLHCVAAKRGAAIGASKRGKQAGLNSSICDGVALMDDLLCISPFAKCTPCLPGRRGNFLKIINNKNGNKQGKDSIEGVENN
ncbi:hypothetical protein POVCU2_0031060 [Plasmodium ovale curtisi]|uniref:Uncharacterized protein n=1 Tax=Plasmodium ovale curtisi TaxID=864141 RepID=A0A1A8VXY1_PLAOA|nr:hypothetical protein POVCU2_0031060 [Plasmodium ovale curtisi]SBS94484.1 hypothetical protein POVCU1_028440 [Plasmodium ovale curtisi]